MKCKECGFTKRNGMSKTKCWLAYRICGKCARRLHPELYADSYTGMYEKRMESMKEV